MILQTGLDVFGGQNYAGWPADYSLHSLILLILRRSQLYHFRTVNRPFLLTLEISRVLSCFLCIGYMITSLIQNRDGKA